MPDYRSSLEELQEATFQAREVLQELHGVLKDCKRAKAEVIHLLNKGTAILVLECLNEAVDKHVNEAAQGIHQVLNEISDKVASRFNEAARHLEEYEDSLKGREAMVQETASLVTKWLDRQKEKEVSIGSKSVHT